MEITFINVGYGESILITNDDPSYTDGQFIMLIDGGSAMDSEYEGSSGRIRAYDFLMKKNIRHIDLLVFSHVHEDHTCGLIPVIDNIPVRKFWTSIRLDPVFYGKQIKPNSILSETNCKALDSINTYSMLMDKLKYKDITWLHGIKPGYFHTDDLTIDILGPEEAYKRYVENLLNSCFTAKSDEEINSAITAATDAMNNASLILHLNYKNYSVLLCGDMNAKGFQNIIDTNPDILRSDVFKIGHHGQPDSVSEKLIRAVDPSVFVCCASNDYRSNSSNENTFRLIQQTVCDKPVTFLFHDGLYCERLNPETYPRNGVALQINDEGINWKILKTIL